MKSLIRISLGVALLAAAVTVNLHADPATPGHVDFGKFSPSSSGAQFVEVNISSNLIAMVTRLGASAEPEIAEVLHGLQGIRVNVIGLDDDNRAGILKRVKSIREDLDAKGWDRVVAVQEKDQDVAVHLKTRGGDAVQGVAVTILVDNKQAVLVNVVGDIQPDKLATIGERFNIDPLKKLKILEKKAKAKSESEN